LGNGNTAEGNGALFGLTPPGSNNTALGYQTLFTSGITNYNTATGFQALYSTTTGGDGNTATGNQALYSNTTGYLNTATGFQTLYNNVSGTFNTGAGDHALFSNTSGNDNTATGFEALYNTTGDGSTATGFQALFSNTSGISNTANGNGALLENTTGSYNIALGYNAGTNLTTGDLNIDIGNAGVTDESGTIRIGTAGNQTATFIAGISGTPVVGDTVIVDANGQLGTLASSQRFKEKIKPMDQSSEAILALKPVTFFYKHDVDPNGIPQFGLVAEEVERVNPALVTRDAQGKVYTVRYEAVNAMLLNEFLKQHRKVEEQDLKAREQDATITELKSTLAQERQEIKVLTASLKEQASQIQKVSARLEANKPAPRVVHSDR
jgi:hypothetical protein